MLHPGNVRIQNIPHVDELRVNWNDNICKLIHKKCHYESYHSDITYHTTLNTIFSVVMLVAKALVTWALKSLINQSIN